MKKKVDRALAVFLVGILAFLFLGTMILYGRNYAYGFFVSYKDNLPENPSIADDLKARVDKLKSNVGSRLIARTFMRESNAKMQMLLGKDIISIGVNNMVKLRCGAYYGLFTGSYSMDEAGRLADFALDIRNRYGIPTLFVYCHSSLYEDGQLPEGMDQLDNNLECADALIDLFKTRNVAVVDSRDAYARAGLTMDEAINKSDIHWTHRMALETAFDAAKALSEAFDLNLSESALACENFDEDVYESLLLGEFGRRIGSEQVTLDDVHALYPAYDTHILYEELNTDVRREGTFKEAVLNEENLARDPETGYSENAYYIYGHYLAQTHTVNENGAPVTVLVFKDSYGTPVSAFLGLAARDVYAVDLRSTDLTMEEWVEKIRPDVVLFAYSQQMLRKFEYVIAE